MVVLPRPPKPHFLQSPLPWLHPRLQADLTQTAKLLYALLLERRRSGFSKPNRIYVKLPPLCAASSVWSLTARVCTRSRIFCPRKRCFARLPILPQRALATAGTTSLKIPTAGGELAKSLLEEVQERFTN